MEKEYDLSINWGNVKKWSDKNRLNSSYGKVVESMCLSFRPSQVNDNEHINTVFCYAETDSIRM